MGQATLDDDDLFGEAAAELREDITAALDEAETALPAEDDVWTPEGGNLLGQLNTLRSTLEADETVASLREAKKWIAVAERSGAIEDDDELIERLNNIEQRLSMMTEVRDATGNLTAQLPELRQALQGD